MERITLSVKMDRIIKYEARSYAGWGFETRYIYKMTDEEGKVYVWKTTSFLCEKYEDEEGWDIDKKGRRWNYSSINEGDVVTIKASFKGESDYKGEHQIELTRVVVVERTFKAETPEERAERIKAEREEKKAEQLASLDGGDWIWKKMPYRQYKEHYSDCETVIDSFEYVNQTACVDVIIREGRLKASGVRGKHYHGFRFTFTRDGKEDSMVYRAVSEETAMKRFKKDFPNAENVVLDHVYQYWMS